MYELNFENHKKHPCQLPVQSMLFNNCQRQFSSFNIQKPENKTVKHQDEFFKRTHSFPKTSKKHFNG